jgi:hypothetical protein
VRAISGTEPEAPWPGRWRQMTLILALLTASVFAPAAAYAAFTSVATAQTPVSTLVMKAPDTTATTATTTCSMATGKIQVTLTVTRFGQVARANSYKLIVTDPKGVQTLAVVTPAGGSVTVTISNASQISSQWTYELRGDYEVPNTNNVWTGPPTRPVPVPMPRSCSGWGQDQQPSWGQEQPWGWP